MKRGLLLVLLAVGAPCLAQGSQLEADLRPVAAACEAAPAHGLPVGPVALGYYEGDMAVGRRVCPRTELGLGVRGGAIIDTPNFYGAIAADGLLFGSLRLDEKRELFATIEAVHYQFVQNATLTATAVDLGQLTFGGTTSWAWTDSWLGAWSARFMLPTSTATPNVRVVGAEVGHATRLALNAWAELHGYAGVDVSAGLSNGPMFPRAGATALVGAQLRPVHWFAAALDVNGRYGATTHLAPALALRFRIARDWGTELGGTIPLVGSDRRDAILGLKVSYRRPD